MGGTLVGCGQKVNRLNGLGRDTEYGAFDKREVFKSEKSISQVGRGDNEVGSGNKAQRPKSLKAMATSFNFALRKIGNL